MFFVFGSVEKLKIHVFQRINKNFVSDQNGPLGLSIPDSDETNLGTFC